MRCLVVVLLLVIYQQRSTADGDALAHARSTERLDPVLAMVALDRDPPAPKPIGTAPRREPVRDLPPAPPSLVPDGSYECRTRIAASPGTRASVLGTILLANGTYRSPSYKNGIGTVRIDGRRFAFLGGPLDGWIAATGTDARGAFLRFRSKHPKRPGDTPQVGDDVCVLKKT